VIAPSTYYDALARTASARDLRDEALKVEIARVHQQNYGVSVRASFLRPVASRGGSRPASAASVTSRVEEDRWPASG
jgi:hypothetical protein